MKKKWIITSAVLTTLVASASTISAYLLTNKLMYLNTKNVQFVTRREKKARRYDENWFDNCPRIELFLQSPNGYNVRGTFYQPLVTTNTVIISHGVTENKINSMKYVKMYERLGYNCVVYDHRRHGETGGTTTSYGHYEKIDLQTVVNAVREHIGQDAVLGIHGESMGAVTTLLYAGMINDDADFYISDCAYSIFRLLLQKIVKETIHLELDVAIHLTNLAMRLRDGYTFDDLNPVDAVRKIHKPVLFVHTIPDEFIPVSMAQQLYDAKIYGPKELALLEVGEHAQGFNDSPEIYEQIVRNFIGKYVRKNLPALSINRELFNASPNYRTVS